MLHDNVFATNGIGGIVIPVNNLGDGDAGFGLY